MGVYEKLGKVQKSLKAPKNQFNKFGGYYYRSCEDILEAAKPLCVENGLLLTITDGIEVIADRVYVKATASVADITEGQIVETSAYAREPLQKKGSDESQITGAASSYARKYALNGLFCIDDTKDTDATNEESEKAETEKTTENKKSNARADDEVKNEALRQSVDPLLIPGGDINAKREKFMQEIARTGCKINDILSAYSCKTLEEMDDIKLTSALGRFSKTPDKKEK